MGPLFLRLSQFEEKAKREMIWVSDFGEGKAESGNRKAETGKRKAVELRSGGCRTVGLGRRV